MSEALDKEPLAVGENATAAAPTSKETGLNWPEAMTRQLEQRLTALSQADAAIARIAAAATSPGRPQLLGTVKHGLERGLSASLIGELCLQCTLYIGPDHIESIQAELAPVIRVPNQLAESLNQKAASLQSDLHGARDGQSYSDPTDALMAPLYGAVSKLGYDGIWARPGPSRRQRLICAVAALAVTGSPATLLKFCHAARGEGLSGAELRDVISWTVLAQGGPRTFDALITARDVLEES